MPAGFTVSCGTRGRKLGGIKADGSAWMYGSDKSPGKRIPRLCGHYRVVAVANEELGASDTRKEVRQATLKWKDEEITVFVTPFPGRQRLRSEANSALI